MSPCTSDIARFPSTFKYGDRIGRKEGKIGRKLKDGTDRRNLRVVVGGCLDRYSLAIR